MAVDVDCMSGFTHPLNLRALLSVHSSQVPLIWFVEVIRRCKKYNVLAQVTSVGNQFLASHYGGLCSIPCGIYGGQSGIGSHETLSTSVIRCKISLHHCSIFVCHQGLLQQTVLQRDSICTLFLLQERLNELQDFTYGGKMFEIFECVSSIGIECPYMPQLYICKYKMAIIYMEVQSTLQFQLLKQGIIVQEIKMEIVKELLGPIKYINQQQMDLNTKCIA